MAQTEVQQQKSEDKTPAVLQDSGRGFANSPLVNALGVLAALPLAVASLLFLLLMSFLKRPLAFFSRKARDPERLPLPPSLEGLQHEFIEAAPGVRLHAVSFGRRPGLPLMVLLHGFPECWYSWRHLLAHYRERFEVVAVDMRGYNTSSKPKGIPSYTLEHLTSDVAAVVRSRCRSSCTLVAHDWGGVVAWAAASRYPGLVERLVVLAGPHMRLYRRNLTLEQAARSYYFLWFLVPVLPEALLLCHDAAVISAIWLGGGRTAFSPRRASAATPADVEIYKAALQQPGAATAALNYYRAAVMSMMGLMPTHPEIEAGMSRPLPMPVLVVWGAKDHALCLSNNRDIDKVAPRVEVHVLPDCSHWVQTDRPEEVHRVLEEWLAAHPVDEGA